MTRTFQLLLLFLFTALSTTAQQVPDSISQKFRAAYPDASNATWQWENDSYRVNYWDGKNVEHNIIYDKFGKMTRAQHQIGSDQIPTGISEYYRKNYPDQEDYKVWMEDDGTGKTNYFVPGKNEVMWFDYEGNYSKRSPVKKLNNNGKEKTGKKVKKNTESEKNSGGPVNNKKKPATK